MYHTKTSSGCFSASISLSAEIRAQLSRSEHFRERWNTFPVSEWMSAHQGPAQVSLERACHSSNSFTIFPQAAPSTLLRAHSNLGQDTQSSSSWQLFFFSDNGGGMKVGVGSSSLLLLLRLAKRRGFISDIGLFPCSLDACVHSWSKPAFSCKTVATRSNAV